MPIRDVSVDDDDCRALLEVAPARPCIVWLLLRPRTRLPGTWLFGATIIREMREVQCGYAAAA